MSITHASRSDHRAAVENAPLTITIEQQVRVTTSVDMVGFFAGLNAAEQEAYWSTSLGDAGYSEEYERPLAYLAECAQAETVEPFLGDPHAISRVDGDDYRERVTSRAGTRPRADRSYWDAADFDALVAAVPWLAPPLVDPTPEQVADLARVPGPLDSPLF